MPDKRAFISKVIKPFMLRKIHPHILKEINATVKSLQDLQLKVKNRQKNNTLYMNTKTYIMSIIRS